MLIGPNGSGKTTLLNIISGFIKPDSGRVLYKNIDITNKPPYERNRLGLVRTFQTPRPFENLTVLENMLVAAKNNPGESVLKAPWRKTWIKIEEELIEKAESILRELELYHLINEKASSLSGGQLKLLEVGRALMNNADTVLMDEPIAGVNPKLAHRILYVIRKLIEHRKITFLIIEHRLDIALRYVDHVYAMSRGRVISHGKPEEVVKDPLVVESYLAG